MTLEIVDYHQCLQSGFCSCSPYESSNFQDHLIEEAEKTESGSSEVRFQITEVKEKLARYNINNDLMLQIPYPLVVVVKSKVINTTIGSCPPPNEVLCYGQFCHNQGKREKRLMRWDGRLKLYPFWYSIRPF
jgi:hypothetical protein